MIIVIVLIFIIVIFITTIIIIDTIQVIIIIIIHIRIGIKLDNKMQCMELCTFIYLDQSISHIIMRDSAMSVADKSRLI